MTELPGERTRGRPLWPSPMTGSVSSLKPIAGPGRSARSPSAASADLEQPVLTVAGVGADFGRPAAALHRLGPLRAQHHVGALDLVDRGLARAVQRHVPALAAEHPGERRSEEHTSALQSLLRISYTVFCLQKN